MMGFLTSSSNSSSARRLAATSTFKSLFSNKMSKKATTAAGNKNKKATSKKLVDESDRTEDTVQSKLVDSDKKSFKNKPIFVDGKSECPDKQSPCHTDQQRRKSRQRSSLSSSSSSTPRERSLSRHRSPLSSSKSRPKRCNDNQDHKSKTLTCKPKSKGREKVATDSTGRCPHHPYVQLKRLSHRTGKWKTLLDSCPLCDAMVPKFNEDPSSVVGPIPISPKPSFALETRSETRSASKRQEEQFLKLKPRSRSHSRPRSSKYNRDNGQSSPKQRSRSHSQSRRRVADPIGLDSTSDMIKRKLSRQDGVLISGLDGSTATLITSNIKNSDNSDCSAAASFAKAAASLIVSHHKGDETSKKKRVCFIDISGINEPYLVTQVHTRPFTTKSEKKILYYSEKEIRSFRQDTKLDLIAERAKAEAATASSDTNDRNDTEAYYIKNAPLLLKLLFNRDELEKKMANGDYSCNDDVPSPQLPAPSSISSSQRSRSHSRPRRPKVTHEIPVKQRSRSHSQTRRRNPPARSYSSYSQTLPTTSQDPLGLDSTSNMVNKLHQKGFFSVEFDGFSATLIASNNAKDRIGRGSAAVSFTKAASSIHHKK